VPNTVSDREPKIDRQLNEDGGSEAERKIREHVEHLLDLALEESFPASDPPSIALPPEW
jgi:hypothetical protein